MRECFNLLLAALMRLGRIRVGALTALSRPQGDRQAIFQHLARTARPFEAYLLCMLVPQIAFSGFPFTWLEKDEAVAKGRRMVQEIIGGVDQERQLLPAPPPFQLFLAYLISHLQGRELLDLFEQMMFFRPEQYPDLHALFDLDMRILMPLAVAAFSYAAEESLPAPEFPTGQEALLLEMWAQDAAVQAPYMSMVENRVWREADDAHLEHARVAMVNATVQLRDATDGTAAARLLRMHDQYQQLRAELHVQLQRVSESFEGQLQELTRWAALLRARLPAPE
jgi:hypothetical protein